MCWYELSYTYTKHPSVLFYMTYNYVYIQGNKKVACLDSKLGFK